MARSPWVAVGIALAIATYAVHGQAARAGNARRVNTPIIGDWDAARTVFRPIPLRNVKLGGFLGLRVAANNKQSLMAGLDTPIPAAIEARSRGEEPPVACRRLATDSDFFKWLEGACYAVTYDPRLKEVADAIEGYEKMLLDLQEQDGFLGTRISPAAPFDDRVCHDLYVAGHFIEAAVAHYKATGRRNLLDAACRLTDFYLHALKSGHPYFEIVGKREHPEIELALVRLYRATEQRRFLDFAADIASMSQIGPAVTDCRAGGGARHAVRLCYLLTGAAELYMETGDESLFRHLLSLWDEIVSTRMYVTGGIGYNERIPDKPYDLPQCLENNPHRDIAETCASVAMMMFSWRLHAITGESRFFDVIETILYNHYLGAISQDHLGNFYYNPLRRVGDLTGQTDHHGNPVRRTRLPEIHSTTCCLPNAWRFFGQLPEYVFSVGEDGLAVNLYTEAVARHRLPDGTRITIEMETRYPHEGTVRLRMLPEKASRFRLRVRIPGWCENASVTVANGKGASAPSGQYYSINRVWNGGDQVVLELPMEPVAVLSHPEITANRGQIVFRRGPLVYCLEKQDAGGLDLQTVVVMLDREEPSRCATAEFSAELGFYILKARAGIRRSLPTLAEPYFPAPPLTLAEVREIRLIPFFFRANRDEDTRWITFIPYE